MRKLVLILIIILSASLLLLAGCDDVVQYEGVKVVFMLEGGTFQNGEGSVVYYYQFPEGAQTLIRPLEDFASDDDDLVKNGYDLEGWYLTKKTDKDGNVSYTDKWNFDTDTVDEEGVTLYACWKKQVKYTYQVYDFDTDELIATREVNQGVKFNDRYATRNGYTLIGLFDENKNPWDSNFTHPGGETDTAVKVYAKYLEGDYTVVRTATELKIAANGNNNIYIANDIDMQGESLSFKNFTKEFLGNNCTISNFVLSYSSTKDSLVSDYEDNSKNSLSISLFGDTNGAKICDVNFTGVTVDVDTVFSQIYKIYVAPISVNAVNTEISNVTVEGTVTISRLPSDVQADMENRLVLQLTDAVCFKDQSSTVTEFTSQLKFTENNLEE